MTLYHLPRWQPVNQIILRNSYVVSHAPSRFLSSPPPSIKPTHFLPDLKQRLGKCILFGLEGEQIHEASQIAKILAREWSGLAADFSIGPKEKVRWGEMVIYSGKCINTRNRRELADVGTLFGRFRTQWVLP